MRTVTRSMALRTCVLVVALLVGGVTTSLAADTGIRGHVTDPAGLPLPGVTVLVSTPAEDTIGRRTLASTVSDENGDYTFDVPNGRYELATELAGFQAATKVVVVQSDVAVVDLSLALAGFQDSVTITAETPSASLLPPPQPNAPVTVSRTVMSTAMLPNSRYEDVLTLMPNVERGPDNRISIGGTPATTGALVVNGFNETDPAGGLPGVVVPIDAVDTVDVHTGGYAADLGRATGGVTSIQTRAGANQFHTSVDSMFPRFLFENGGIHGVEYWEPNVGVSGPIVKGRLFFQQAVSYRYDRYRFTTLAGPERSTYNQPLVWSQLDGVLSSNNRARVALAFDQQHTDHANITAFTPDSTVPKLAEDGWSAMASDRITLASGATFEFKTSLLHTISSVAPSGTGPYLLGHTLASGGYFDDQLRRGKRVEGGATLQLIPTSNQVLKIGATADEASLSELDTPSAVSFLRSDGTIARTVTFDHAAPSHSRTFEAGAFVQDTWSPTPSFVLDGGLRYDHVQAIGADMVSPRVAWTWKPHSDRTSITGSAGLFVDKFVLSALAFPAFPVRTVQDFDPAGSVSAPALVIANRVDGALQIPRAGRWDVGFDRTFSGGWQAHVRYQERHGGDELVLQPSPTAAGLAALTLSSSGRSTERGFETTVGYRQPQRGEFYVSYVRASARGNLNTFESLEGLTKEPFVQPDQIGSLPTEIPNRLLAWGLLRLPGEVTLAPFLTMRNGFPYSPIDDTWKYVGVRDGLRLPPFTSLDISVTRVIELPRQLPHARVGLKLYNLISTNTEREIQRDVALSEFGARYDPVPRDFSVVCVFLLGQH